MSMVLEYPAKMVLYIVVIIILIGIMWNFRSNIANLCLFPPCEKPQCETKTYVQDESSLTKEVAEKYCNLCWEKNQRGECNQDWVCYGVNLETEVNPSSLALGNGVEQFCNIKCNENTKTVFFEYDSIRQKVDITC